MQAAYCTILPPAPAGPMPRAALAELTQSATNARVALGELRGLSVALNALPTPAHPAPCIRDAAPSPTPSPWAGLTTKLGATQTSATYPPPCPFHLQPTRRILSKAGAACHAAAPAARRRALPAMAAPALHSSSR